MIKRRFYRYEHASRDAPSESSSSSESEVEVEAEASDGTEIEEEEEDDDDVDNEEEDDVDKEEENVTSDVREKGEASSSSGLCNFNWLIIHYDFWSTLGAFKICTI